MPHIAIISASVRTGRNSHRVALFFKQYLEENHLASAEILDLAQYQFPVFEERLKYQPAPAAPVLDFAARIRQADGVIIATPEYNGGYPAGLKNVVDLLYEEWHRKPIAITTASNGAFGGSQVITSLQFSLWKIRAWVVPAMFPVPKVQEAFDEQGNPSDKATTEKRARTFVDELLWCVAAKEKMAQQET
jgi:NAD(P)H-dependent FMN reductase